MKSAGKARNNGLYRHIRTSKEIIRNLLNDYIYKIMNAATGCIITVFCHFPSPFHKPFPNDLSFICHLH